jgi:phage terminase large subunit-like protein
MDLQKIQITDANRHIVELLLKHKLARENFTDFIKWSDPSFKIRASTKRIIDFVQTSRANGQTIGIISAPPRIGKSHLSTALAAFELVHSPKSKIVLASYAESLAIQNSRRVQSFFSLDTVRAIAQEIEVNPNQSAYDNWSTTQGGMLRAVGVGGGLTGFGATLAIIDDPHSNLDAATSQVQSKSVHEWFSSVLMTRLEKTSDGRKPFVLLIATRWSLSDLTSHVLQNYQDVALLNLPAIDENDVALETEFEDFYRQQKSNLPSKIWSALYQGSPIAEEGALFSMESVEACTYHPDQLPPVKYMNFIAASDYALGGQDRTCHVVAGIDQEGVMWITDIYWQRAKPEEWFQHQMEMAKAWDPQVWFEENDAASKVMRGLRPRDFMYSGFNQYFKTVPTGGKSKEFRAHPLSRLVDTKQVRFPKHHPAWSDLLNELIAFPGGPHDDFVDACALLARGYGQTRNAAKPVPADVRPEHWNATETLIRKDNRIFINPRVSRDLLDLEMTAEFSTATPNRRIG